VPGKPLGDTHRLALLDEGLYWDDGQMRGEVYNWGSFAQSRMHAAGVTCADCHDPHSLKLRADGNAVCAQCHAAAKYDVASHTHHRPETPAAACTACHMPTATHMEIDARHDHSLRIPRPDLSATLGVPNACGACHAERGATWAAAAIATWTGRKPASYQRFAEAFAGGAAGAPGARGALLALIEDPAEPAIVRASALGRLARWLTPALVATVVRSLNDPDANVRVAAVAVLSELPPEQRVRYLARLLDDPVRVVRIEAARALAGPGEALLPASSRAAFARALDEYIAAQIYNADRPEGPMNLANLFAARGDVERAIAEYRKALAIDPTFIPAYANLADAYRTRGAEADAEALLREGIARNPEAATLHHALGLSLVRQRRIPASVTALREAARLAPDDARFAYVYAVALHDAGRRRDALATLSAALERHPYDRDLLSALAQFESGENRAAALDYARRLVKLDPESREYLELERRLEAAAR